MENFLCLYSYHAQFILPHKSEKAVTEINKKIEPLKFLILPDWIIENDLCQILCMVLEFFVKQEILLLW